MGNDLKETPYAPATKAEVSQFSAGQTPQPSEDPDAARHRVPTLQEPSASTSRLPDLRDLPGPGGYHDADARTRQLASPTVAEAPFITLHGPAVQGRAFVFPGQGAQSV